jgi:hypothetical protein
MAGDFLIELVTQDDHILKLVGQYIVHGISGILDAGLPQKVKARPLNHTRPRIATVCAEEDRCTEDSFEGGNETSVLGPPFLHTEGLQHLGCAPKADCLTLLPHRQSGQKNGDDTILSKRYSELRMAGDLKDEVSIPALIWQLPLRQRPQRQTTQNKRPRAKTQGLPPLIPVAPNQFDSFYLPEHYKELACMKKEQVDIANKLVFITDSKTPTGISEVPLTDIAVEAFQDQLKLAGQDPGCFQVHADRRTTRLISR